MPIVGSMEDEVHFSHLLYPSQSLGQCYFCEYIVHKRMLLVKNTVKLEDVTSYKQSSYV